MPADASIEQLIAQSRRDGMVLRELALPPEAVVRFCSVLEAYEGLAAVFADRRQRGSRPSGKMTLVTTPERASELDAIIEELYAELAIEPMPTPGASDVVG